MIQAMLTVAAGKRLIGKGLASHPDIKKALDEGTIVIIAGTTNGYVAEEILKLTGQGGDFNRSRFFRGVTMPPAHKVSVSGRLTDKRGFPGDVIIRKGKWIKGKTINEIASELIEGDIILKGANALDSTSRRAAIIIGNENGGTIIPVLQASIGRRVRLIIPVGLEKRIPGNLDELACKINAPGAEGYRILPITGEVFTEQDALFSLAGVTAEIFAAGGIGGAEGCIRMVINGLPAQEKAAEKIIKSVAGEVFFTI